MHIISFFYNFYSVRKYLTNIFVIIITLFLCACNTTNLQNYSSNPNDPFEKTNRKIHAFNKHIDETTLKPAANIYGNVVPRPVRLGAANFYENLQEPKRFFNHLGQAEFIKAATDVTRFAINTSIGVFGVFDVASRISLFSDDTEFDETFALGAARGYSINLRSFLVIKCLGNRNCQSFFIICNIFGNFTSFF